MPPPAGGGERRPCDACGVRLRGAGVSCVECGVRVHGCCTGVSAWRRRGLESWRCSRCSGGNVVGSGLHVRSDVREARSENESDENPRQCGVCRVRMRRGQNGVACADCGLVVHNKCCSMSRWERERGGVWHCGCGLRSVVPERSGVEPEPEPESGGAGEERDRLPAGKCDVCKRLRRRGQGIACVMCKSIIHVKCADLGSRGRAQAVDRSCWECAACLRQRREREDVTGSDVPLGDRTGGMPQSIVIMQWNCDHFSSKIPELEVWLQRNDVDVAVVQESKLRDEDGEVRVRGYEVLRRDRWRGGRSRFSRGGGLVTLVRRGWAFREIACGVERDSVLEAQCVEVVSPLGVVWRVMNVYAPPESVTGACESALESLRVQGEEARWVVCGDFNGHHRLWDTFVGANARGAQVLSWSERSDLVLLNDGSATRAGRGTGSDSAPDVTFCSPQVFDSLEWGVVRELGSDHFPILIRGEGQREAEGGVKTEMVWNWGGAQWEKYQEEIRRGLEAEDWGRLNLSRFERQFRNLVLRAARKWVCLLYTSPSPRDLSTSRMPSSA